MRGSRMYCQKWSNLTLTTFFSWWGERESKYHLKWTIDGPPGKCLLNGVSLVRWKWSPIECWHGSFVIFQWIRTSIAKEFKSSVMFQGVGLDPLFPHLDPVWIHPLWRSWSYSLRFMISGKSDLQVFNWNGGPGIFLSVKTDFIWSIRQVLTTTEIHGHFLWRTETKSLNHSCTSKSCKRKEKKKKNVSQWYQLSWRHSCTQVAQLVQRKTKSRGCWVEPRRQQSYCVLSLSKTLLISTA